MSAPPVAATPAMADTRVGHAHGGGALGAQATDQAAARLAEEQQHACGHTRHAANLCQERGPCPQTFRHCRPHLFAFRRRHVVQQRLQTAPQVVVRDGGRRQLLVELCWGGWETKGGRSGRTGGGGRSARGEKKRRRRRGGRRRMRPGHGSLLPSGGPGQAHAHTVCTSVSLLPGPRQPNCDFLAHNRQQQDRGASVSSPQKKKKKTHRVVHFFQQAARKGRGWRRGHRLAVTPVGKLCVCVGRVREHESREERRWASLTASLPRSAHRHTPGRAAPAKKKTSPRPHARSQPQLHPPVAGRVACRTRPRRRAAATRPPRAAGSDGGAA